MPRCAFLTLEDPSGWVMDDDLAAAPMAALGWSVETIPWTRPDVQWQTFDAVVIRSTWDYTHQPERFLAALSAIRAPLFNPFPLVRWNLRKTYLRDLEQRGVPVVPTVWREGLLAGDLSRILLELGADEVVLKPVIGASAGGACRVDRGSIHRHAFLLEELYAHTPVLAQPFLPSVVEEGEFSLIYFDGELSHSILKTPRAGDFRVQEEHGGSIVPVDAGPDLREAGGKTLDALGETPLYARVDLVRDDGGFRLMELELIEPSLYLRMDPGSPERFARALHRRAG